MKLIKKKIKASQKSQNDSVKVAIGGRKANLIGSGTKLCLDFESTPDSLRRSKRLRSKPLIDDIPVEKPRSITRKEAEIIQKKVGKLAACNNEDTEEENASCEDENTSVYEDNKTKQIVTSTTKAQAILPDAKQVSFSQNALKKIAAREFFNSKELPKKSSIKVQNNEVAKHLGFK